MKLFWAITCILKKCWICIFQHLSIKLGKGVHFRKGITLLTIKNNGKRGKIIIGKNTFFNQYTSVASLNLVRIGDDCLFGENVKIYDHNHVFNKEKKLIRNSGYKIGEVVIGNNVWVGSNCVILKGTKIGDNSVIGAGCIISGIVPPNSVVSISENLKITSIKYE